MKRRIVKISEITSSIPPGKIKCYVTAKLRKETPEEHIRQRMCRSLVEEYGYSKSNMALEWIIQLGSDKKRADIVIFDKDSKHLTENIEIIVEAKKESIKPSNADSGIEQLKSYMSAAMNCKFGLWVGSEIKAFQKLDTKGRIELEESLDIPFADGEIGIQSSFSSLVPATDILKDVFKRCHNYIAANQGGSKEVAFYEFLKMIFCKVFDEKFSDTPKFYISQEERRTKKGHRKVLERIENLFKDVLDEYGYIFDQNKEKIELKSNVVAYIVGELQKYSLLETDFDYKGQAYEEIVGSNSRGERGEFFTPRNLCNLAVEMIYEIVGPEKFQKLKVLDPSCGTGGFLKTFIYKLSNQLYASEVKKWKDEIKAKEKLKNRLKNICDRNVFGIDFNPVLVRAAQMNLVMHGDGSSNIFHENTLKSWGEYNSRAREKLKDNTFDVILSNPPFGKDLSIDDAHILNQYELPSFGITNERKEMAPQQLFIERSYRFLKKGGFFAVVSPDNIVSNPSFLYVRNWLLLRFNIIASVSFPTEMFQPSTGTQTTLLILQKRFTELESLKDLEKDAAAKHIFMSSPTKIGHDLRGVIIPKRDEAGNIIMAKKEKKHFIKDIEGNWKEEIIEIQEPVPYDMLPQVLDDFKVWLSEFKHEIQQ